MNGWLDWTKKKKKAKWKLDTPHCLWFLCHFFTEPSGLEYIFGKETYFARFFMAWEYDMQTKSIRFWTLLLCLRGKKSSDCSSAVPADRFSKWSNWLSNPAEKQRLKTPRAQLPDKFSFGALGYVKRFTFILCAVRFQFFSWLSRLGHGHSINLHTIFGHLTRDTRSPVRFLSKNNILVLQSSENELKYFCVCSDTN